jgi:hypothetical protein
MRRNFVEEVNTEIGLYSPETGKKRALLLVKRVKSVPLRAKQALRGGRGTALPILNLGA